MIQQTKLCDRCGEKCTTQKYYQTYHFYIKMRTKYFFIKNEYDDEIDLCDKCYEELTQWILKGKEDKNE